jgi:ATP-dependent Clp protease ATP-binding subunit ClpB
MVDEPAREDSISILRGIREIYEAHHKVLIRDVAIMAAVDLSTVISQTGSFPTKAIVLKVEAAQD